MPSGNGIYIKGGVILPAVAIDKLNAPNRDG